MNIRLIFTIALSKLIILLCRIARRGGTSLAGKVALKIYPGIAGILSRGFRIIMVTGTNGKTTTARIIGKMLECNGVEYISNISGANLASGVINAFIDSADILGRHKCSTALIEIDEAAFQHVAGLIHPDILVVTNFFRDQLDRYGELYSVLRGVMAGIAKAPGVRLVLNADDSLSCSLGTDSSNKCLYYGISPSAYDSPEKILNSDAMFCFYCKSKYVYSNRIYGHLGGFACPSCGYRRPDSQVTCVEVRELTSSFSFITAEIESDVKEKISARINLPGIYNIYNALAAVACGLMLNFPPRTLEDALQSFECGFGRMETISADGRTIRIILVKNPTGFNQVIDFLLIDNRDMHIAFAINDKLADGTDISWLWDVDFEKLQNIQERVGYFFACGIRAEDMALRLKYAGIDTSRVKITRDYKDLIRTGIENTGPNESFYILPTYTAMLDIRKVLKNKYSLREFWK